MTRILKLTSDRFPGSDSPATSDNPCYVKFDVGQAARTVPLVFRGISRSFKADGRDGPAETGGGANAAANRTSDDVAVD